MVEGGPNEIIPRGRQGQTRILSMRCKSQRGDRC